VMDKFRQCNTSSNVHPILAHLNYWSLSLPLHLSQRTIPHLSMRLMRMPNEETFAPNDSDQIIQQRVRPIRRRIARPTAVRGTARETNLGQN
jgi:hypothetical protein